MDSVHICGYFYSDYRLRGYLVFPGEFACINRVALADLQPVVTIILAIPLLNEVPSSLQVIGSLLTLARSHIINYAYQQKNAALP